MIQSPKGSLTILDTHTSNPKVYWNGTLVLGLLKLRVFDSTRDDKAGEVRLKVLKNLNTTQALDEMRLANIIIKEV